MEPRQSQPAVHFKLPKKKKKKTEKQTSSVPVLNKLVERVGRVGRVGRSHGATERYREANGCLNIRSSCHITFGQYGPESEIITSTDEVGHGSPGRGTDAGKPTLPSATASFSSHWFKISAPDAEPLAVTCTHPQEFVVSIHQSHQHHGNCHLVPNWSENVGWVRMLGVEGRGDARCLMEGGC